jgi:hypothetical protein
MVRVVVVAAVAPLGRAVQDFVQMLAVPWRAAEASQEKGQGGRKSASLSMDERLDASIPYNEDGLRACASGCRRARL